MASQQKPKIKYVSTSTPIVEFSALESSINPKLTGFRNPKSCLNVLDTMAERVDIFPLENRHFVCGGAKQKKSNKNGRVAVERQTFFLFNTAKNLLRTVRPSVQCAWSSMNTNKI